MKNWFQNAHRAAHGVASRAPYRLALFALIALVANYPLLTSAATLDTFRDAHVLGHYEEAARITVARYHQAPLWDPWYCGGMYLIGTPQSRFVSPSFLLTLIFGEGHAESLIAFLFTWLGLEGAFRYARVKGATSVGAMLAAPAFALSGTFAVAGLRGWINFYGNELLPWVAFGVVRALSGSRRGLVVCAVSLAVIAGFGGTYAAPMAAMWCGFEVVFALASRKIDKTRAIAMALAIAFVAIGLAAVRLLPVAETLAEAPRIIGGTPGVSYTDLTKALFRQIHSKDGDYTDQDGSFFIGTMLLPATVFALRRRKSVPLIVMGAILFWLSAGYAVKPSLFSMLRTLPLFSALRYPERYLTMVALVVSTLGAQGIGTLQALSRKNVSWRTPAFIVIAAALTNLFPLVRNEYAAYQGRELAPEPIQVDQEFHQARGNRWVLMQYTAQNRGSLSCWDAYPVPQSKALRGDLEHEAYLSDPAAGSLTESKWTPNELVYSVDLHAPATLLVNQNYHPGWKSSVGEVTSKDGLIGVDLPSGKYEVNLTFSPRSARAGNLASVFALVLCGVFLYAAKKGGDRVLSRRALVGLVTLSIVPLAVARIATAAIHEPTRPSRAAAIPDGSPVVVDALPVTSKPVGAKFDANLTLEGVRITSNAVGAGSGEIFVDPGDTLTLELDFRATGEVPRGLGVFVHIDPSSGEALRGDHILVSGVLDLEDAPKDKILRDIVTISVHESLKGKRCRIFVGLWGVRRDGNRVSVTDKGGAEKIDDNRVEVGAFDVR